MVTFSVIITTYNSSKTILKTLGNILNQDGIGAVFNLDVIVVDDCSTDNTVELLKSQNIRFFSTKQNSGGPNAGRNIGLSQATGDYITIVDHDDDWNNDRILSVIKYINNATIITSGYTVNDIVSGEQQYRYKNNANEYLYFPKNQTFISKLTKSLRGQTTYLGTIIFSKQLKHIKFEEKYGLVDFDWILSLFYNQDSIEICKSLYVRNVEGSNLSMNENYRKKDYQYSMESIEKYRKEFPEEVKTSSLRINGTMARYYYYMDNMKLARKYFLKSGKNMKTLFYLLTSYFGSTYVKKKFNVFG